MRLIALASFVLGLVPAALLVALGAAKVAYGSYGDVHSRMLLAYITPELLIVITPELLIAPVAILYPLVVLAAPASLVVPHLRRRYAGGLWTAALLNSIVGLVVVVVYSSHIGD